MSAKNEEVFISYSQDSVEHVKKITDLSDRLRSEGIDCVLDQYQTAPPEGWPRWMDRKIRDAKYVLLVCTEIYYQRVMGEEKEGIGLGIRWEGNLIYQHFYNSGAINTRFIPVILKQEDSKHIPTPMQGSTHYNLGMENGYEDLYLRLIDQPKVKKPKLGKRKPLPKKPVKTNPIMYLTSPIDVELWNRAQWGATFYVHQEGKPPVLGLAFRDEESAIKIFEGWHDRYGNNDKFEELRISIIEGDIPGVESGYSVHICSDPETAVERYKAAGYEFDEDILMMVSRINRMPSPDSPHLKMFKDKYRQYKTYLLAPGVISPDGKELKPLLDLAILKNKVLFRDASAIGDNDADSVVKK